MLNITTNSTYYQMKKITFFTAITLAFASCSTKATTEVKQEPSTPKVYFTQEISPEALLKVYEALELPAQGKVAVKISTGEKGGHNYLKPELIGNLVKKVNGTIVECNTAYNGKRNTTEDHLQTARDHGFFDIANVDIMDAESEVKIPVQDTTHIKYNIVGKNMLNYDFMINLAHFKGHAMGGFGGVLKNQSIGNASANGKAYIHSGGKTEKVEEIWDNIAEQDIFLESMASAAQSVHEHFKGKILYINVMNNLSVDCDCDSHPADPEMQNIGILASLDPVALDQACLDLVFNHTPGEGDNNAPLIERINSRHGTHIVDYAQQIGLGSKKYELVSIDGADMLAQLDNAKCSLIVRNKGVTTQYNQHGVRDLYDLVTTQPSTLRGAHVADKIIGKGAATLMVNGEVKRAVTHTITSPALKMLQDAGIEVSYENEIPYVENKKKTGQCPLDERLQDVYSAQLAMPIISQFIQDLNDGKIVI